jgi:Trp operon repressor
MKRRDPEERLRTYLDNKYEQRNITTLLNMMQGVMKENEELKERLCILEQILHMHLPEIDDKS